MFSVLGAGLFVTIWWSMIFVVLPFGIRSQRESGFVVPGSDPGAPAVTRLVRVVVINTAVSVLVWLAVWAAIDNHLIDIDRWTAFLLGTQK